jgi:hypothetical protein
MKKILTITLLTLSSVLYGQLQNFDSGVFPPVSPNAITTPVWGGGTWSGNPATWYRSDDPVVNGSPWNRGLDVGNGGSGNCAILYSNEFEGYRTVGGGFQVDMIINNIDMSSYAAPRIKFYVKHPDGSEEVEIAASNMGGPFNLLHTISTNYSDWTMVSVDLSVYVGSSDVSIRFRGTEGSTFPPVFPNDTNIGIDEILIEDQTNMVYLTSTTSHVGCGLKQGYNDQPVMRIDVTTQGNLNPFNLTELLMNTNGSSDDCNDVLLKKIYATGSSNVFNPTNLIGSSDLTGNYSVSSTIILNEGINYFWVACDVPITSTLSNVVDAECTGLVIDGNTEIPTVTAPAGNLLINNTGVFAVTNLNDTGAGSLRAAITSAYAYGCGEAVVDATGVSGTINWGARIGSGPNHSVKIIGSGPDQLIVDGVGAAGFLFHFGDGSLNLTGFQFKNFGSQEIVYKPNGAGDLILEDCWFDNNSHRTIYFVNSSGSFSAANCTFSNNSSVQGTMYFPNIEGTVNFSNCTFYNNSSSSTAAVFYAANIQGGLFLDNCTLLNNSCPSGTGGIQSLGGSCTAVNTTFENTPNDFRGQINMNYSHMSNTTSAAITGANNILNVPANLGALVNNGGTTPTCSINPGSPLINAGTANIEYDQRGFCRPNTSDIGAFEYNGVQDLIAPVPDVASLSDVTNCSPVYSLAVPSATDNCSSVVSVTSDACLPILASTVVTWTYDDGNANTSTQTQNIVIADVSAPVPDAATLADVTGACEVTLLMVPTATDNCSATVTVTNNVSLPITAQGTTVVTWTYDDGNGNIATQTQNVINSAIDATAALSTDGGTITANTSGAVYAWINCDLNTTIAGETGQSFTPLANGNYAVIVTVGNCSDTSACENISTAGIDGLEKNPIVVYPNPSNDGYFNIQFEGTISAVVLYDMLGRIIKVPFNVEQGSLDASSLAAGKYIIRINSNDGVFIEKIVVAK